MTDFNYKKYSLEKLEEWMHDAMSSAEASPQEIYDVIKGVVEENYYTYKYQTSQAYELLALLNGNGQSYEDVMKEKEYYEPSMPPWGHSDLEYGLANPTLTEDRNSNFPGENTICDNQDTSPECKGAWNSFWEDSTYSSDYISSFGTDDYNVLGATTVPLYGGNDVITFGEPKKDKVVKWQLPVEVDGPSGEYFVTFPDDLLEAANLKEGDKVEWVDNLDGSYLLRKV